MALPPGGDRTRVRRAVADLIRSLGLDPANDPELARSPERITDLYEEMLSGLADADGPELVTFPNEDRSEQLVVVRDLEFHSMCVHHFAPFFGRVDLAYVPGDRIVGISAPARLVDLYARRPQLQERMTRQIADHFERLVSPRGVAVLVRARHLCMEMRGVRRRGTVETRVVRGVLAEPRWAGAY